MREIKFKVYITDSGGFVLNTFQEWLDGDGWKHDYYSPLVSNGVFSHQELGDGFFGEIIRVQFTGLKDSNGVEIYEGDIVKTITDKSMVIGWSIKFASFVIERDGWAFSHYFGEALNPEDCIVVGNIHQNKDLLK